ncbi:hypothetical protein G9U53_31390 [Rhodococcus sp. D-46]|uniref:hypothetical protein n=1 Tax=unclassified Rhodococcus (in: high G+C Gram-positive bacteria) TaxID=192944 RepID=UPI0006BA683F|nr:hypothetical protein [Rhodococcus sp. ADH]KPH21405.1 hypothetical protein AN948_01865 [Rhodococcus sp. ADH]NHE68819.1 hypothetical protein [Rhodococcus sp. D-46]RGP47374.1 hypothetical protein AWH04_08565 [Rhodococcus erythropolis]
MRRAVLRRSFVARTAASVAVLALPLCSSATAAANPPPAPAETTTEFQVPVRFVAGCLLLTVLACDYPLPLSTVTPSATTGAPGDVTFRAERSPSNSTYCIIVVVNWRNLTTGVAGTTMLQRVEPDYSRLVAPEDWCRYVPATAVTGSGTIAAVADLGAYALADGYQILVNPGLGTVPVP